VTAALALAEVADPIALAIRATLLMGAAWAAAAALRKAGASAAARHMAWLFGIAALLALPVLAYVVPDLRLPLLPAEAATSAAGPPPAASAAPFVPPEPVATGLPIGGSWSLVLLLVYALGAAIPLLRLVVGRRMLRRLWGRARTATDPAWERMVARISSEMGLSRRVELRIARGPAVPMTWGTLAPKVLLPAEAAEWPPERRRMVLLHELAHVARFDSLSRSAASLACAIYWFHPGAWLAARQMRMEQEQAADDRVLMGGGSPQAYALSLLELAGGAGARPRFEQAAAMAGMDQLERRLVAITSAARRKRPGAFFLSSSALLAALGTLVVAAGVPVSASTTPIAPMRAKRAGTASGVEMGADSARPEDRSARDMRGETGGSSGPHGRLARQGAAVAGSSGQGPAERLPARRGGTVSTERDLTGPATEAGQDRRPSAAEPWRN
jgi:beta-lactamase regulating signal transducer with metallopeptidase domain